MLNQLNRHRGRFIRFTKEAEVNPAWRRYHRWFWNVLCAVLSRRFLRTFKVIVVSYFILLVICIITCKILPKYRIIIIYIIVKACLGQRKFDSKLCLIIIYEAFINVSGSIHNCDTLMTAYTFLKKSVSLICVYTRTLLQQFLQSYTIQLTAQR